MAEHDVNKLEIGGKPVEVECAIRDSMGNTINSSYPLIFIQENEPTEIKATYALWINSTNGLMKYYSNGEWNNVYSIYSK